MTPNIIVIEDEPAEREMICFNLRSASFDCREAENVPSGLALVEQLTPTLMLIDWMLPGKSGIDLIHMLKANPETREIPLILLTARGEENDKITGLESGADDYIVKPFSPRELIARIRALLRRSVPELTEQIVKAGELTLDPIAHAPLPLLPSKRSCRAIHTPPPFGPSDRHWEPFPSSPDPGRRSLDKNR